MNGSGKAGKLACEAGKLGRWETEKRGGGEAGRRGTQGIGKVRIEAIGGQGNKKARRKCWE